MMHTMTFSMDKPPNLDIIKSHPIGDGLNAFRDVYRSTCADLGVPGTVDGVQQIIDKGERHLISPGLY